MRRVLVLGGYGTFGGRIAGGAPRPGSRCWSRGEARPEPRPSARAASGSFRSRSRGACESLWRLRPFALVDAAGPFQGLDYESVRAAVDAGCHYLDIADAPAFVCGIGALDAEAEAAGVCVIAGASTVPALSGAVAGRLAEGVDE